ncbi:MAG: TRCF domain-containing protein, partial [Mycetocola sp.]
EAYQKLSAASAASAADGQIDLVVDELVDRYGELPPLTQSLIQVSRLRQRVQRAGIGEFVVMGSKLRVAPVVLPDSLQARLRRLYPTAKYLQQAEALLVPLPERHGEILAGAELRSEEH